nr:ribonuclease H-like domain-containing protein [Tanacetum cinerariifolium]
MGGFDSRNRAIRELVSVKRDVPKKYNFISGKVKATVSAVPSPHFNFLISHISALPKSPSIALSDPNWRAAMYDEYNALVKNSTWMLVPKPPNANVVRSMWLFRHKYHADGFLSRYKARLVSNGSTQQVGGLQYLTFIRPDISYAVQQVCLHMHDPREPHLATLKRVLRYVRGTLDFGLQLYASITGSLVAYIDVDWAGCPTTRRSTSGYCVFLGDNLLLWSAKRQHNLSRSSAEAEYKGVANVVVETAWLRNLLRELHTPLLFVILVYCDNNDVTVIHQSPIFNNLKDKKTLEISLVANDVPYEMRILSY